MMCDRYPHYHKEVPLGVTHIDVYRLLRMFKVSDPSIAHAVKKLLVAGGRGDKDASKDVAEAIASLERWQELQEEELASIDAKTQIEIQVLDQMRERDAASAQKKHDTKLDKKIIGRMAKDPKPRQRR